MIRFMLLAQLILLLILVLRVCDKGSVADNNSSLLIEDEDDDEDDAVSNRFYTSIASRLTGGSSYAPVLYLRPIPLRRR